MNCSHLTSAVLVTSVWDGDDLFLLPFHLPLVVVCLTLGREVPTTCHGRGDQYHARVSGHFSELKTIWVFVLFPDSRDEIIVMRSAGAWNL
jgi:hypothetical protein